jgi:hypothetical protein
LAVTQAPPGGNRHVPPIAGALTLVFFVGFSFSIAVSASSAEQRAAEPSEDTVADQWQFETVQREDGTVHQGLILAEGEEEIELVEIVRLPGKPMFAVIRPVHRDQIIAIQRLEPPQRERLIERIDRFRRRARIEAGRMEDIDLQHETDGMSERWIYDGPWFRLESTADHEMTRRSIVRIEQIFRAYRQILPPRVQPSGRLLIELFGTMEDYRRRVHQSDLEIAHPAFYSSSENRILAGSDLNAYAQRLARAREHHAQVRREYRSLHQGFPAKLSLVLDELRRNGYSEEEVELESRLRRSVWQREYETALARIETVERQNQARFAEVTRQMFALLYHEAFHAYVQNYVYPNPQQPVAPLVERRSGADFRNRSTGRRHLTDRRTGSRSPAAPATGFARATPAHDRRGAPGPGRLFPGPCGPAALPLCVGIGLLLDVRGKSAGGAEAGPVRVQPRELRPGRPLSHG